MHDYTTTLVGRTVYNSLKLDGRPVEVSVLTVEFEQEDGMWIGTCLELGTSTQAQTLEELQAELTDAVDLQLNEMARLGYTRDYLRAQGAKVLPIPQKEELADAPEAQRARWGMLAVGS